MSTSRKKGATNRPKFALGDSQRKAAGHEKVRQRSPPEKKERIKNLWAKDQKGGPVWKDTHNDSLPRTKSVRGRGMNATPHPPPEKRHGWGGKKRDRRPDPRPRWDPSRQKTKSREKRKEKPPKPGQNIKKFT